MTFFKWIKNWILAAGPRYSWKKVLLVWTLSVIPVSGSVAFRYLKGHQNVSAGNTIRAIVQTTPQTGAGAFKLETTYLAEVLNLSADSPADLYQFDLNEARKRLTSTHIIKDVKLKKMKPDLLFISYTTRTPLAMLADFANTAFDDEGSLFPYAPFFPACHLPRIYLAKKTFSNPWGETISEKELAMVAKLFSTLGADKISQIDLSQIDSDSQGKRELVIKLKEGSILRLIPKNYVQQLANYSMLKSTFLKNRSAIYVDLRTTDVAYIQSINKNNEIHTNLLDMRKSR